MVMLVIRMTVLIIEGCPMGNQKKIRDLCSELELHIVDLYFDRSSCPTPDGYACGGQWYLTLEVDGVHYNTCGEAQDVLSEIDEVFGDCTRISFA